MTITVYRGTHQIGGCATEIRTASTRILIDLGSELPGEDGVQPEETLSIPGVTEGVPDCDGVFFTHTHGDHIGQLERIAPEIPLYMGATAKELCLILNQRLSKVPSLNRANTLAALTRAQTFVPATPIAVGNIRVTPFFIDHSAFDAYMFLIEADGLRVLHTGDFRLHGFRGSKTIPMLEHYVSQVDWLICEGTMLSREREEVRSERELQVDERKLMEAHPRVFVLCSSMNIDRIAAFIKAKPDNRPTVCDPYQKDVLRCVEQHHGAKTSLYRFGDLRYNKNTLLHDQIEEQGCLAFIRANTWSRALLDWFDDGIIVYSMWRGYLTGKTANPQLSDLLKGRDWTYLHTSGHAGSGDIVRLCETVNPRCGIIPIHSEAPQQFEALLAGRNIALLTDGEPMKL